MDISIMEEKIKEMFEGSEKQSWTYNQVRRKLGIRSSEEKKILELALHNLEIEGYLYLNDYDEYQLFSKHKELVVGELRITEKGHPFILSGRKNIFIPDSHLNGAIVGDIVLVKRNNEKVQGNSRGTIVKILKREKGHILFDFIDHRLKPVNWPVDINVSLPDDDWYQIVDGSRVLLKLSLDKNSDTYQGQLVKVVGHKDDPNFDILTIASKNGFFLEFSDAAKKQARELGTEVKQEDIDYVLSNGGLDLRNDTIFTIDGPNTKDIDDAVGIELLPNGNYLLKVCIANISYFIKPGTPLDLEAKARSTSVYPYNNVFPMFPHEISNGIGSLNPNVDRLAFACIMQIDKNGIVVDFSLEDAVINSKKKMVYDEINDIFERNIMHEEYKPFIPDLALMIELYNILEAKKRVRGALNFGDGDIEFMADQDGIPLEVKKEIRGTAHKMIENFMLVANETVASFMYWLGMGGVYRVHPAPDVKTLKKIVEYLNVPVHVPKNSIDNPKALQSVIDKIQIFDEGDVYKDMLLQAMKTAYYSPNGNTGHFGLAYDRYTHFTSPIRRYPDLMVHRLCHTLMNDILSIDYNEQSKYLEETCIHCSKQERLADKTEREANHYKMAEYMESHIGETFIGYIHYLGKSGVTIKTEDLIFGKINNEDVSLSGLKYDTTKRTLTDSEGNPLYLGDKVEVIVKYADKITGKVSFIFKKKLQKVKQKVS